MSLFDRKKKIDEKYVQLAEQVVACFGDADPDVEIQETNEGLEVTVSQMYEHLPLNFAIMEKLAEAFGTKEYEVNNWSARGCATCDYGSKYAHEFRVPKKI